MRAGFGAISPRTPRDRKPPGKERATAIIYHLTLAAIIIISMGLPGKEQVVTV